MNGKVVLIAHNRPETLKPVIQAIKKSISPHILELIAVFQGDNPKILELLEEIDFLPVKILRVNRDRARSTAQAINMNVYLGISCAFEDKHTDYVVIIEDDIVVSADYFNFAHEILISHRFDPRFRGFNGFSGIPRDQSTNYHYGKYRYGVGWGWAITRGTWIRLARIWQGCEDAHWDGLVEPFFKSGYVISPGMSRIQNIGFGEGATHTSLVNNPEMTRLEDSLNQSFVDTPYVQRVELHLKDLNWRTDCIRYMDPTTLRGKCIDALYFINYMVRRYLGPFKPLSRAMGKFTQVIQIIATRFTH